MTEQTPEPAALATQDELVLAECVRLIFARATRSYLLVPPVAGLLIWMESAQIGWRRLAIWAAIMAVSFTIGLSVSLAYHARGETHRTPALWLRRRTLASTFHGLAWGSSALLIMPGPEHMEYRVLTLAFLVGVTSTLVVTHTGVRATFPAVAIPLWIPAIAVTASTGDALNTGAAITTAIYLAVMLHYNSELNRDLVTHVRIGIQNAALADRLAGANLEAEEANRRLRALNETVREMAVRDDLTGSHNRRYLMQELEREIARAGRSGSPLWVAIADIDHFKQVNDLHGHLIGDELLTAIALTVRRQVRSLDCLARYGGEEFALVLPGIDQAGALECLERIREEVSRTSVFVGGTQVSCTLSIGATHFRPPMTDAELLSEADAAMYAAKAAGRNRVTLHAHAQRQLSTAPPEA